MLKSEQHTLKDRFRPLFTPPRMLVGSFLLLILAGTTAFQVLPGLYTGARLSWLDALFTATSAVCVTGLVVENTATYFTTAGQALILVLIQFGGLGIVTFTTLIILALGRRLSLGAEEIASGPTDVAPHVDFRRLTRGVILFSLLFEAAGAGILYFCWAGEFGARAAWHALFQSVSAFCNAGFSTFPDSLTGFREDPAVLGVVMILILVGGIGFLTVEELKTRLSRRRPPRLSLNSRIVLATTAILVVGGAALFLFFEWRIALGEMPAGKRALNALFMSVTARTAGFNTVDYSGVSDSSIFLSMILMFIGGSPGSTAGGVKTTTAALLGLLAWSRLRGRGIASLWHRSIPEETMQRTVGLSLVAFGALTIAVFVFTASEIGIVPHTATKGHFVLFMFEATSAFNTVGLTMGGTTDLTTAGRILTILLMFLGRVGPLTFAAAIALRRPNAREEFRYAYEDVIVG